MVAVLCDLAFEGLQLLVFQAVAQGQLVDDALIVSGYFGCLALLW